MMLRQLEQTAMYNAINFSLGNNAANSYGFYANSTVTGQRVAVFLCPSDPNAGTPDVLRAADGRDGHARPQLRRLGGDDDPLAEQHGPSTNAWATQGSTGLFWWYKSYGIQSVTDGTSNTVAFSEALVSNGQGRPTTTRRQSPSTRGTRSRGSPAPAARRSSTTPTRTRRRSSPGCRPATSPGRREPGPQQRPRDLLGDRLAGDDDVQHDRRRRTRRSTSGATAGSPAAATPTTPRSPTPTATTPAVSTC